MSIDAMKMALEGIAAVCEVLALDAPQEVMVQLWDIHTALRAAITEAERTVTIGDKAYVQQGGYLMGEAERQEPVAIVDDAGVIIVCRYSYKPGDKLYTAPQPAPDGTNKLWLWKNLVNGKPEYWVFDNPFPVHVNSDDPQTLGEPCGYAIFKASRNGRPDVAEAEVLRRIAAAPKPGEGPNVKLTGAPPSGADNGD